MSQQWWYTNSTLYYMLQHFSVPFQHFSAAVYVIIAGRPIELQHLLRDQRNAFAVPLLVYASFYLLYLRFSLWRRDVSRSKEEKAAEHVKVAETAVGPKLPLRH